MVSGEKLGAKEKPGARGKNEGRLGRGAQAGPEITLIQNRCAKAEPSGGTPCGRLCREATLERVPFLRSQATFFVVCVLMDHRITPLINSKR